MVAARWGFWLRERYAAGVSADEKQFEFQCDLAATKLKADFDLPKMDTIMRLDL